MPAAVFEGNGRLSIIERPVPSIGNADDVLIEVEACGICGTDVHILEVPPAHPATPGVIMGHELVGIVRETGPHAIGIHSEERVAVAANLSCGSCSPCKRGNPNHCEHFTTMGIFRDGGLARFAVAPASACHVVGKDIPREIAALTEPLSCVVNGIEQARLLPGEAVTIIGAGPVGLLFLALFRAAGAGLLVVVEPTELRRDVAKRMGADVCLDPSSGDPVAPMREATSGAGADVVVDAVGDQFALALSCVRVGGRVLLFGMDSRARQEVRQYDITRNELTVLGAYVGSNVFPKAARILASGLVDLGPMISHRVNLEELPRALAAIRKGSAVKVVVDLQA
ncbi:MAG: alcohol dehydrogenase catalytic domain-containing protein [Actinomycetota bacterium]|nr:alcohol dehydrogenase catalytic domain-containing protein [Actinomycetota bacterium]